MKPPTMMTTAASSAIHTPAEMPLDELPPPADVPLTGLDADERERAVRREQVADPDAGCGLKPVQSGLYASSAASFHSMMYG